MTLRVNRIPFDTLGDKLRKLKLVAVAPPTLSRHFPCLRSSFWSMGLALSLHCYLSKAHSLLQYHLFQKAFPELLGHHYNQQQHTRQSLVRKLLEGGAQCNEWVSEHRQSGLEQVTEIAWVLVSPFVKSEWWYITYSKLWKGLNNIIGGKFLVWPMARSMYSISISSLPSMFISQWPSAEFFLPYSATTLEKISKLGGNWWHLPLHSFI